MTHLLIAALALTGCSQPPRDSAALDPEPDDALNRLYRAAYEGDGQALEDLVERASAGEPGAQSLLGNFYSEAFPDDQEKLAEAFQWRLAAAKQGWVAAQLAVSHFYLHGRGVDRDPEKGLTWLRIAAEQGEPLSLYHLGNAYRASEIADQEQNLVQTYKWWTIMIRQIEQGEFRTFSDAEPALRTMFERRDRIGEHMTLDQIAEAARAARNWTPKSWGELQAKIPL